MNYLSHVLSPVTLPCLLPFFPLFHLIITLFDVKVVYLKFLVFLSSEANPLQFQRSALGLKPVL